MSLFNCRSMRLPSISICVYYEEKHTSSQLSTKMKLPIKPLHFIYHFVKQQWVKFSLIAFASMMWALNDSIYPYFLKNIVNSLQATQGDRTQVYASVANILGLLVLFW